MGHLFYISPPFFSRVAHQDENIAEILRDLGLLTRGQIDAARSSAGEDGLIAELVRQGVVSEEDITRALASENAMEFVDLTDTHVEKNILDLLEADDARRYHALPLMVRDGVLVIALDDPMAMQLCTCAPTI